MPSGQSWQHSGQAAADGLDLRPMRDRALQFRQVVLSEMLTAPGRARWFILSPGRGAWRGEAPPVTSSPLAPPGAGGVGQCKLVAALAALKANNFPDPEALLQTLGIMVPESISVDAKPTMKAAEREQALRRLPDLHKRIQQQQDNIEKFQHVIQEDQKELKQAEGRCRARSGLPQVAHRGGPARR